MAGAFLPLWIVLSFALALASTRPVSGADSSAVSASNALYAPLPIVPGPTFRPDLAPVFTQKPAKLNEPRTLPELLALSPDELERVDMARRNLLCAVSLPGSEELDIERSLAALDELAQQVKAYTEKHLQKFRENPHAYRNERGSEAYFRVLVLIGYLHTHFGISYNPELRIPPGDRQQELVMKIARDSRNAFLHGLLFGRRMGTCASIPVLVAAVGQRLGYPIKLANSKNHLFARWESSTERFNIEATQGGLQTPSDDEYKKFPYPLDEETIRNGPYLKTMTAAEETADFLVWRGTMMMYAGRGQETTLNALCIQRLVPHARRHDHLLKWLTGPPPQPEMVDGMEMPISPEWAGAIPVVVWHPDPFSIEETIRQAEAQQHFVDQIRAEAAAASEQARLASERRIEEINAAAQKRNEMMAPHIAGMPAIKYTADDPFGLKSSPFVVPGQSDSFSAPRSSGRPTNPYGLPQDEYLRIFGSTAPPSVSPSSSFSTTPQFPIAPAIPTPKP